MFGTAWTLVRVYRTYTGTNGEPVTGRVSFRPVPNRLVDVETGTIVIGVAIDVLLDANGLMEVQLPATDDPDVLIPWGDDTEFVYEVRELFPGGETYTLSVPASFASTGMQIIRGGA